MFPILFNSSLRQVFKESAQQVRLPEPVGHEILNRILNEIHNLLEEEAIVNMEEINLKLREGKLVSISCGASTTSQISVKQEENAYVVVLWDCAGEKMAGKKNDALEIRIAVVA